MYFLQYCYYLPLEKTGTLHLNKLESPSAKNDFCWNLPRGSGADDFLNSSVYIRYFKIISPWKRAGPFICTNLNPLYQRIVCAQFGWNCPSGSAKDFFNWSMYFSLFHNYLPFEKGGTLHLNKLKSPLPKDTKFGWNYSSDSWEYDFANS